MKLKQIACSMLAVTLSTGFANAATITLNGGGSSLAYPTYTSDFAAITKANASHLFSYEAVGSGAGQNAFLNNNINYFEPLSDSNPVGYAPGTLTYGTIVGKQVDFGASDAFLSSTQLTNPATGSYAESSVDGPLIQIPTLGVPITIPYNESGETGTLALSDAQLCGVLSGKITDWHSLVPKIPAGTTINVVYRTDGSGTTFLLTQHLNAVCTSGNSNFSIPVPVTKTFVSVFPNSTPPSNFTGESGSGGVAIQLVNTANSFGYLSPDYTSIAPNSPNTTSLKVASLKNATNNVAYQPNISNTTIGLAHGGAGSTNPTPPSSQSAAMDPLNWVPAIPVTTAGYSIVGYTTLDLSSCYANKSAGSLMVTFINDVIANTGTYATITKNDGFVPLVNSGAAKFASAVKADFTSNSSGYGLNVDNATLCSGLAGR